MIRQHLPALGKKMRGLALAGAVLVAGACNDATGPQLSRVRVELTDAPSDIIAQADVWISQVYLQGGGNSTDGGGGRVVLFENADEPLHFDLLTLQDGVTADLTGYVDVDVATYQSLRLVVDSARIILIEGVTFEDGTDNATLFVPSGSQSGIKVKLNEAIEAAEGESVSIVVDFDVDDNFVIQGDQGPRGVRGILFTPSLKERGRHKS